MKKILLIEDNQQHATRTEEILMKLKKMYRVKSYSSLFIEQNGQNRNSEYEKICNYIKSELYNNSFDILMIDMLLGGDSADDPLGLQIIKDMETELSNKYIIVYTEMSADELNLIKTYNNTINRRLKIVTKPDLQVLTNKDSCAGQARKEFLHQKNIICEKDEKCTCEEKFLCSMTAIYYELED